MGAGASMGSLPDELLVDGQIARSGLPSNMPPVAISKDFLQGLRRKSFSEARRKSGARRASKQLMPVYEIPSGVTALLDKIGLSDSESDNSSRNTGNCSPRGSLLPPQNKTTKLVAHIFDCLDALQHLVRADQGQAIFNSNPGDVDAAMEKSSASLGQLVHEMVTIYSLCGDTMKVILDHNPEAAGMEDRFGRLPLHAAVDTRKPWIGSIMHMIEAYPEALSLKDGAGRLPLHIAVDQEAPNIHLIKLLVKSNSAAAGVTRGVGRLPIHYAVFPEVISYEMVDCLIRAHPEGCRAADVYGRLPLHYAVDKPSETNVAVIQRLLEEYPEGADQRDSHNKTPLMIALDRSGRNRMCIGAVELLTRYSTILNEEDAEDESTGPSFGPGSKGVGPKSLLSIAMDVIAPNLDCIRFLAKEFPETILKTNFGAGSGVEHGPSVDLSRHPHMSHFLGVANYFKKSPCLQSSRAQLPAPGEPGPETEMAFCPSYAASSPLFTSLTKGWSDATRVLLQHCRPDAVILWQGDGLNSFEAEAKSAPRGDCVDAAALLKEMNWRARLPGLLISINGPDELGPGLSHNTLSVAVASDAKDNMSGALAGGSPRGNLVMIPENRKPSSAASEAGAGAREQARLSGVNLLLLSKERADEAVSAGMSVDDFDDNDSVDDSSIDLSVHSFRPHGFPSPNFSGGGHPRRRHNLFRKLYLTDSIAWQHVILFL